jgi:hypothetical protein
MLHRTPFFTGGGAKHDATQSRLTLLGDGAEGIIGGASCKVRQLATAGAAVLIGDGALRIKGRVNPWQGSYSDYNIGDEQVAVPANDTANTRYDLLVVRVEDPQFEGTRDPLLSDIIFPELIAGVPAGTKTLAGAGRGGYSAIPLARLEIPATTSAITNAMIVDLRFLAAPLKERSIYRFDTTAADTLNIAEPSDERFPQDAFWDILVPSWAAHVWVTGYLSGVKIVTAGIAGLLVHLNDVGRTSVTAINEPDVVAGSFDRKAYPVGGKIAVPAAARGLVKRLQFVGYKGATSATFLETDGYTTGLIDVQFEEGVV